MLSYEFCKISKETFFTEHLWTTAFLTLQAESNMLDLLSEYEQFTNMTVDETLVCCCEDFEDSLEELDSGFGCT